MPQSNLVGGIAQLGCQVIRSGTRGGFSLGKAGTFHLNLAPQFLAVHGDFRRRRNAQLYRVALDTEDGRRQLALRYHDFFAKLATENEHRHFLPDLSPYFGVATATVGLAWDRPSDLATHLKISVYLRTNGSKKNYSANNADAVGL
jgi:hypothetical protein